MTNTERVMFYLHPVFHSDEGSRHVTKQAINQKTQKKRNRKKI